MLVALVLGKWVRLVLNLRSFEACSLALQNKNMYLLFCTLAHKAQMPYTLTARSGPSSDWTIGDRTGGS